MGNKDNKLSFYFYQNDVLLDIKKHKNLNFLRTIAVILN